jgi:hypothetical protein
MNALLAGTIRSKEPVPVAGGFDELMPKTLATATVDRLLHHAHLCDTTGGESVRLAQATTGRGVVPLVDGDGPRRPNGKGVRARTT